ncbi:hypothetical protein PINS_up002616 [Pythium insidiosum]|nr:hypothetical protein PINS_up002616 [Pythium insidiosum]
MMEIALEHVAVGCNAISNALTGNHALSPTESVAPNDGAYCAAFAAKNGVALVTRTPREQLHLAELLLHRRPVGDATRVTSVFLHAPASNAAGSAGRVLAGDSEGNVWLWTRPQAATAWEVTDLSALLSNTATTTAGVSAISAVQTKLRWLYVIAFSDGRVVVMEQPSCDQPVTVLCWLALGVKHIMETIACTTLRRNGSDGEDEEEDVLVASGGVDCKVHLFEVASGSRAMKPLITLEGHKGWLRAVDFQRHNTKGGGQSGLLLASASQDQRVRLWKITSLSSDAMIDASANCASSGYQAQGECRTYSISFDALLIGHEDWVTSLKWSQEPTGEPILVSTSMENSIVVWKRSTNSSGSWLPALRVGDLGGSGLLSSVVLPPTAALCGRLEILALNFSGQLERWQQEPLPSKIFHPVPSLNGHCSSVTDLSWAPQGNYLLSTSLDQTTRILAPFHASTDSKPTSWHEISRAQVHGYDINCAAFLRSTPNDRNDRFVCGADEKILRVFEAPDSIQALVRAMQNQKLSEENEENSTAAPRIQHAYLPALSLTNKNTDDNNKAANGGLAALDDAGVVRIAVGDTLASKTLWPEQRKLYGHGNEILCAASNHQGTLVASACKSREERFATIWLWNTTDWSAAQSPLEGHKSSVVQLAFSPNDEFLVSVSKDRQFCVFQRRSADATFVRASRVKAHKRIIWSCSWAPDSKVFVTASRDQTIAFWSQRQSSPASTSETSWAQNGSGITMESAVTAVSFAPWTRDAVTEDSRAVKTFTLAVGLETGPHQDLSRDI